MVSSWCPRTKKDNFLDPLPIGLIWGVGPTTERRLHEAGIYTIGQLAKAGSPILADLLGRAAGAKLAALSVNVDERTGRDISPDEIHGCSGCPGRP